MATSIVRETSSLPSGVMKNKSLNGVERYVVRSAHPVAIYFQFIGVLWFVFYFWNHLWVEAIVSYFACKALSMMAVSRVDVGALSQTLLGRLALLHLHGSNLFLQLVGLVVLIYGLWTHETRVLLTGATLLLLGHVQGWGRVDPSLKAN